MGSHLFFTGRGRGFFSLGLGKFLNQKTGFWVNVLDGEQEGYFVVCLG